MTFHREALRAAATVHPRVAPLARSKVSTLSLALLAMSGAGSLLHCSGSPGESVANGSEAIAAITSGIYTISDARSFAIDGGYYHWNGTTTEELYSLTASNTYQQWQLTPSGSGFKICNVGDGAAVCLSDGGSALTIGSTADVWTASPSPSGAGYTLQDQRTGRYVTDAAAPANGASVGTSSTASVWTLTPQSKPFQAGTYTVADAKSFAIDGGYYHWSGLTSEELYALTPSNTYQQWQFATSGSGFTICNVGAGASACLSDGGSALDIGVGKTVWTVAPSGLGYTIQSQSSQHYIGDAASPGDGAAVVVSSATTIWSLGAIGAIVTPPDSGSSPGACPAGATSIKASGATGNGSTDDTAAIQKALNAASAGATVCFPAGTYKTSASINIPNGLTLVGESAEIGPGAGYYVFGTNATTLTVRGLVFNGGGIDLGSNTSGAIIDDCTFENISNPNIPGGVVYCNQSDNLQLTNNVYKNLQAPATGDNPDAYSGLAANTLYNSNALVMTGNTFSHFGEGAHIIWSSPESDNRSNIVGPHVANNVATGQERIWLEMQTACTACVVNNTLVENNSISHPDIAYWATFGISAAIGGSVGTVVRNNTVIADNPTITAFMGYGIEMFGTNMSVLDNTVEGPWGGGTTSIVISYYDGYTLINVGGNTICGNGATPIGNEGAGGPWPSPGETDSGNTIDAKCAAGF